MIDTAGCPTNLTIEEQVAWASLAAHPMQEGVWETSKAVQEAVKFETQSDLEVLDESREKMMRKWVHTAGQLKNDQNTKTTRHAI